MENGHGLSGSGGIALVVVVAVGVLAVVFGLPALDAWQNEAAANREIAEAEAHAIRTQANTESADAAQVRMLATLPYALAIIGGGVFSVLLLVLFLDRRKPQPPAGPDPALLAALDRWRLAEEERNRQMWRTIAQLSRQTHGEIVIYDERGEHEIARR